MSQSSKSPVCVSSSCQTLVVKHQFQIHYVLHFSSVRTLTPWSFESVPPHIKGSVPQDCRTVDSSWKPGPLKGSWSPSSCSPICWGGSQGSDALLLLSLVCSKGHSSEEPCGQRDVEGGRGPPRPLWLCHLPAPQNPR